MFVPVWALWVFGIAFVILLFDEGDIYIIEDDE